MHLLEGFIPLSLLAAAVNAALLPQAPLAGGSKKDLIYELKIAEIIPTVLEEFEPTVGISVFWENATAEVGNTIPPSRVQEAPSLQLLAPVVPFDDQYSIKKGLQYTVALTDPDAPSRDNPEWSEICHWIATGVELQQDTHHGPATGSKYDEVMPYKPPGPPEKTGKHRYVFVAFAPTNGTTETLHLSKPDDRQHWGFKHERQGLRKWAKQNGLSVVGANFIYAQNEKQ